MSEAIIKVENLGKKYLIKHQQEGRRYVALRDVLSQKLFAPFKFLRSRLKIADGALRAEDRRSKMEDSSLGSLSTNSNLQSSGEAESPISQLPSSRTSTSEDFWALRDVSFEVRQGEVVGIIGLPREIDFHQPTHWTGKCTQFVCRAGHAELPFHRGTNGAGKSTLLKILSSPSRRHYEPEAASPSQRRGGCNFSVSVFSVSAF